MLKIPISPTTGFLVNAGLHQHPQSTQIEGTDSVFDILLLISVAAEMSADVSLRS